MKIFILIFFYYLLISCSENNNESKKNANTHSNDNIWKTQTNALKQANSLADQLNKQFDKKAKKLNNAQN